MIKLNEQCLILHVLSIYNIPGCTVLQWLNNIYNICLPYFVDYDLMPLEKVERFVSKNKHLPEIPSAKEVENNGVDLMEMNVLLLKKVEELTLHTIAQEKRIKSLESSLK